MAFTVTARASQTFQGGNEGGPGGATTASFTPNNNSLLLAVVHCLTINSGTDPNWTLTDSLGGTWTTKLVESGGGYYKARVVVFARKVTTGAAMTVTATPFNANDVHSAGFSNELNVIELTGYDDVGTYLGLTASSVSQTTGGSSFSLGGTSDPTSLVFSALTADGAGSNTVINAGAGWTLVFQDATGSTNWQRHSGEYKTGAISTVAWGDVTFSGYDNAYAALEIKAATGVPFALDGSAHGNTGSSTTVNVNLTTTHPNDYIIVGVSSNGPPINSVVGGTLGAFTLVAGANRDGPNRLELWAKFSAGILTSETITVTQGSSNFMTVDAFGVSGSGQTSLVWDTGGPQVNNNTPGNSVPITTVVADTFLIGLFSAFSQGPVIGAGTGFTPISTNDWQLSEYKILTSAQTVAVDIGAGEDSNAGIAIAIPLSSGGPSPVTGTIAAVEAKDTAAITGAVTGTTGTLGAIEAKDIALINGAVRWNAALAATEAPDTALINGAVRWNAALAATEAPDTALISGAVRWNAALAASEAPDTALINGATRWNVTLAATEAPDTALINGATRWNAALAALEAPDTALIQGTITTAGEISGSLVGLEAPDTALINGTITGNAGILVASEAPDTAAFAGAVRWNAALAASEATDTALINGAVRWNALLAAVEASDIALIQGTVSAPATITGTLNAQEAPDTAFISGTLGPVPVTGTLNAQEASDTALIVGNLVLPQLTGILAATEAPDTARINVFSEPKGLPGVLVFGRTVVINRW